MPKYLSSDRERVLAEALGSVVCQLGISDQQVARIFELSESEVQCILSGKSSLSDGSAVFQKAVKVVNLYTELVGIVGEESAHLRGWMHADNGVLGDKPVNLIVTLDGFENVLAYLREQNQTF